MKYSSNSHVTMIPRGGRSPTNLHVQRYGTRVQLGSYIADIVPDDEENPSIHHCIVQRVGSPNMLYLGQEGTFRGSSGIWHRQVEELVGPRPKKPAAIYEFKAPSSKSKVKGLLRCALQHAHFPAVFRPGHHGVILDLCLV